MTDIALPLFGDHEQADRVEVDGTFATARRVELDDHSWVEHVPGWLSGADRLFEELVRVGSWEQRRRWIRGQRVIEPRLTAVFNDLGVAPESLRKAARALTTHYGVRYDRLWINRYRNHRDSTGWHGDGASTRRRECVVPVLSLGVGRRFLIRPRAGGPSMTFRPMAGDLIVMGGRCQKDWQHCVPKQTSPTGSRISVNFAATSQTQPD